MVLLVYISYSNSYKYYYRSYIYYLLETSFLSSYILYNSTS